MPENISVLRQKKTVTVHSGCCNKNRQQKFIAHSSGGWRSKIRVPDGQGRVDSWFRASLPFHMMRGVRGSLRSIL